MGGFLAETKSQEDQDFADSNKYLGEALWIGLRKSGNLWVWDVAGEQLTEPTHWKEGEPDGGGCVYLHVGKHFGKGWVEYSCDYNYTLYALCQS